MLGKISDKKKKDKFSKILQELKKFEEKSVHSKEIRADNERKALIDYLKVSERSLTYGTTHTSSFLKIVEFLEKKAKTYKKFTLLGSSAGRIGFYAHFYMNVSVTGYEIIKPYVRFSNSLAKKYKLSEHIQFERKDILFADLLGSDIIWISRGCWEEDIRKIIHERILKEVPEDTIIVAYQLPPKEMISHFYPLSKLALPVPRSDHQTFCIYKPLKNKMDEDQANDRWIRLGVSSGISSDEYLLALSYIKKEASQSYIKKGASLDLKEPLDILESSASKGYIPAIKFYPLTIIEKNLYVNSQYLMDSQYLSEQALNYISLMMDLQFDYLTEYDELFNYQIFKNATDGKFDLSYKWMKLIHEKNLFSKIKHTCNNTITLIYSLFADPYKPETKFTEKSYEKLLMLPLEDIFNIIDFLKDKCENIKTLSSIFLLMVKTLEDLQDAGQLVRIHNLLSLSSFCGNKTAHNIYKKLPQGTITSLQSIKKSFLRDKNKRLLLLKEERNERDPLEYKAMFSQLSPQNKKPIRIEITMDVEKLEYRKFVEKIKQVHPNISYLQILIKHKKSSEFSPLEEGEPLFKGDALVVYAVNTKSKEDLKKANEVWNSIHYIEKPGFLWDDEKEIIEKVVPEKGAKILEIGCGNGRVTKHLYRLGNEILAIDNNLESLRLAKSMCHKDIDFLYRDANFIDYPPNTYDVCCIFENTLGVFFEGRENLLLKLLSSTKFEGKILLELRDISSHPNELQIFKNRDYLEFAYLNGREKIENILKSLGSKISFKIDVQFFNGISRPWGGEEYFCLISKHPSLNVIEA